MAGRPQVWLWWWFVGCEAGGDGVAGQVVGEAGWAVPVARQLVEADGVGGEGGSRGRSSLAVTPVRWWLAAGQEHSPDIWT
jgi:hypothetical protein